MPETQSLYQIQMEATEIPGAPAAQKRSKKTEKQPEPIVNREAVDKQLSYIEITPKNRVKIHFSKLITRPITDSSESENEVTDIIHKIDSKIPPHKDLVNEMKSLRKLALEICEMPIPDNKELADYTVSAIKIHGDMALRKSRAVLTLAKTVKRTGKIVHIVSPQVVMYGQSDFHKADEMSQKIEKIEKEVWLYIDEGKSEESYQLPLFER
jgi:hypothetical protein